MPRASLVARRPPAAAGARVWALAVLALLALLACGRKTPVRPPQAVAPEVIDNLQARNVLEGVRLDWSRPRDTADGRSLFDLDGFRIERSVDGEVFGTVGRIVVDDRNRLRQRRRFRYTDRMVNPGERYRYRVISFTVDGYESEPSNVVAIERQRPADDAPPVGP